MVSYKRRKIVGESMEEYFGGPDNWVYGERGNVGVEKLVFGGARWKEENFLGGVGEVHRR